VLRMTMSYVCHSSARLLAGVEWFGRVCVALGVDPPAAFRAWVSSLGPELLKGPFNHQERQLVRPSADCQWAPVSCASLVDACGLLVVFRLTASCTMNLLETVDACVCWVVCGSCYELCIGLHAVCAVICGRLEGRLRCDLCVFANCCCGLCYV
jgi:hypothetical protein